MHLLVGTVVQGLKVLKPKTLNHAGGDVHTRILARTQHMACSSIIQKGDPRAESCLLGGLAICAFRENFGGEEERGRVAVL